MSDTSFENTLRFLKPTTAELDLGANRATRAQAMS